MDFLGLIDLLKRDGIPGSPLIGVLDMVVPEPLGAAVVAVLVMKGLRMENTHEGSMNAIVALVAGLCFCLFIYGVKLFIIVICHYKLYYSLMIVCNAGVLF